MLEFDDLFNQLNEQQQLAVKAIDGPVVVNAAPGTGKTQLLAMRIANILKLTDQNPANILCLTFTDSAAVNMRERLQRIIGNEYSKVQIFTFHGLCSSIMQRYPNLFFQSGDFKPMDDLRQFQILTILFKSLPYSNPLASYHPTLGYNFLKDFKTLISACKREGFSPTELKQIIELNQSYFQKLNPIIQEFLSEKISIKKLNDYTNLYSKLLILENDFKGNFSDYVVLNNYITNYQNIANYISVSFYNALQKAQDNNHPSFITEWKSKNTAKDNNNILVHSDYLKFEKYLAFIELYEKYQNELFNSALFDYDDMIMEVIKVLENPNYKFLLYNLQEQFQYLLVDEFQDTNGVQLRLIENLILNQEKPNIMVVGDPDQAIYKFQGAVSSNLTDFANHNRIKDIQIFDLNLNYRSKQDILDLASEIISEINPKQIISGLYN
jgi:DNA helicase II / ATP-dependent DNA helicase PcrA